MRSTRGMTRALVSLLPTVLVATLPHVANAHEVPSAGGPNERVLVGTLERSEALTLVGVSILGRTIRIYVCDGTPRELTFSQWYSGALGQARRVSLRSSDDESRIEGGLDAALRRFTGEVTLNDGQVYPFEAELARRSAFFFWRLLPDGRFSHGLIQLPDGRDRGTSYPPYVRCRPTGCTDIAG